MIRSLAFIRTKARTRILKRRKRSSPPGQPPSVHSKHKQATFKNIRFEYDDATGSGVVGPLLFRTGNRNVDSSQTTPNLIEFGGNAVYRRRSKKTSRVRRGRRVRVKARPFMSKAMEAVEKDGDLLSPYKNVVGE